MRLAVFARHIGLLAVAILMLAACSDPVAKSYSYTLPSTPGGRLCVNQCTEAKQYCLQNCTLDQRRCIGSVQEQALKDYDKYTREQFAAHAPIELRPRDFERTASCDAANKSCIDDCEGPYQSCYSGCGGTVNATTSCQAFCF